MKNTIHFDHLFQFYLLENEEAALNSIWFVVDADEAANPRLQIVRGLTTTEIALTPSTVNTVELEGALWATGADTSIRLINDDYTSQYITITFPDAVSEEAIILRSDDYSFFLKGQEQDASRETQIIRYTNGREYSAGSSLTKIASITYATSGETEAMFFLTINCTVEDAQEGSYITVRLRINRAFDEYFIPAQTVTDGRYTITITYPIMGLLQSDRNSVDVYLSITGGGSVFIAQQQLLASLMGVGLLASGAWTGDLDILDIITGFGLGDVSISGLTDAIDVHRQNPHRSATEDTAQAFALGDVTIRTMTESATVTLTPV